MTAHNSQKQRGFRHRHEADPMMQNNFMSTVISQCSFNDQLHLMLGHRAMCFIIDSRDSLPVFVRSHDAPKIHHRARRWDPSLRRHFQRLFADANLRIENCHLAKLVDRLALVAAFGPYSRDTENEYESM